MSLAFLLFIFRMLCVSCVKSSDLILNEAYEDYKTYDYYVDEYGNEGIIAKIVYLNKEIKYIIVISADESLQAWGPMDNVAYKKDSLSYFEVKSSLIGLAMCQLMCRDGIEKYPAQNWCFSKNHGSHVYSGSWRLPSVEEHKLILGNVKELNAALYRIGGTLIDEDKHYWTCVEDWDNYVSSSENKDGFDQANRAIAMAPGDIIYVYKDQWLKMKQHYVRAIKYIYYKY